MSLDDRDIRQLDFANADRDSESYRRHNSAGTVVVPVGKFEFGVRLTDSDTTHRVQIYREDGDLYGRCACKGYKYGEPPCAHQWGLQKAAGHGIVEIAHLRDALDGTPTCPRCGSTPEGFE